MRRTSRLLALALLMSSLSITATAGDKGTLGFSAAVSVDGWFSRKLTEVKIEKVFAGTPAENAGLQVGDQILAIDGCEIPGCPSSKAKKLMKREPGQILPLLVKKADGSKTLVEVHIK